MPILTQKVNTLKLIMNRKHTKLVPTPTVVIPSVPPKLTQIQMPSIQHFSSKILCDDFCNFIHDKINYEHFMIEIYHLESVIVLWQLHACNIDPKLHKEEPHNPV